VNFIFFDFAILVKWGKEESGMSNELTVTKVWCVKCHRIVAFRVNKTIADIKDKSGRIILVCSVCEEKLSWQMQKVPENSRNSIHVFDEMEVGRP
jgi:RNase P subunit RPR2